MITFAVQMQFLLTTLNAKYIHANLAIRLLYQINKHNENLHWKEFTINEDPETIAEQCKGYDVVAFSCYIWNITQTLEVARLLKKLNPEIKVLLGGPEVSYDWNDVLKRDEVDFIITGEGEIPFTDFLNSYPNIEHIANLAYKKNGSIVYFEKTANYDLTNYSTILPYANDNPDELANRVLYIETSRGCPYKCEFCLASLDNKVRYLPIESIKANLLFLMHHGRVIKFLDRTFNIKKEFTLDIFQFILDNHKPGNVFQFEITADILHPAIIEFINEKVPKGLMRFEIGIQTVNQKANLEVKRKQNFDKTTSIIKAVENKIEMHLDLIVGLPFDYWEDIKYSFERVFKLYPPELQLGFLKFLKGTPVRERYSEYNFEFDPEPPYQIIKSDYLSSEEISKIQKVEEVLEIYWNKKRCCNALQYIAETESIFDFMLGLAEFFEQRKSFNKYDLNDVYTILFDFISTRTNDNSIVKELVALDFYLYYKIKPKAMFVEELEKKEKNKLIAELNLNHHKYRFIIFPTHFCLNEWMSERKIIHKNDLAIIQYDGKNKPEIVAVKAVAV